MLQKVLNCVKSTLNFKLLFLIQQEKYVQLCVSLPVWVGYGYIQAVHLHRSNHNQIPKTVFTWRIIGVIPGELL